MPDGVAILGAMKKPVPLLPVMLREIHGELGALALAGHELVDLAEPNESGAFRRTIIKTENPERYGIRVGDYFL